MRRIVCLFLLTVVLCAFLPAARAEGEELSVDISAASFIVTDDAGEVLFSRQPDKIMQPASTTKLLTALVAVENCRLDREITITSAHTATEGSMMYLRVGESVSLNDLLYGLLLASGNDAALAVAELVAGGTEEFAALMNEKAAELGMDSSRFSNPSGLPDSDCYTTARDMAKLIAEFSKNDTLLEISSTREAVCAGRTIVNHNRLLNTVEGVDGGKTGYTKAAGRCLVTTAERMGRRVFVVTMNAPDDWADHAALFDAAFDRYEEFELGGYLPVSQDIVGGTRHLTRVVCSEVPVVWLSEEEREALRSVTYMRWFEYAPVEMGAYVGKTEIYSGERLICTVELFYGESVPSGAFSGRYLGEMIQTVESQS